MRGWAAPGAASVLWLSACGLGGAAAPAATQPREAAGVADSVVSTPAADSLPIGRIVFERRGVFDPTPPGPLGFVFRIAEGLHVRTREQTVRREMLFATGDRWSNARGKETERALRKLDIFDQVAIDARNRADTAVVRVHTRDAWTTSPEFQLQRGGGHTYGSVALTERNLLGRAKYISIAYREAPEGISRSIGVYDPAVLGTRGEATVVAASGSSGVYNTFGLERPFFAEDTPYAFGAQGDRADNQVRLYASGVQAAEVSRERRRIDAYAGLGARKDGTIGRLTVSWLTLDRTLGPSELAPGAPPDFAGGYEELQLRRFSLEGRLWRPGFVERTTVDGLIGVEDFDLGEQIAVTGGVSLEALGGSTDEGYAALTLAAGTDQHRAGFGWVRVGGNTRILMDPPGNDAFLESLGQIEARWVNQAISRHTLVLAAIGGLSHKPSRDFQFIIGGLNGLRAHGIHALSGDQMMRLNAESRWLLGRSMFQLMSVGAAGFWDAGRTWGRGSGDQPWQHDVGFGLRLSLPGSSLARVARFDIAWTVSPSGAGPRKPVFSFSSSQAF